jgi:hypothetical protein
MSVLYSISDNNSYLRFNRDPVDMMIGYLKAGPDPLVPSLFAHRAFKSPFFKC